MKAWLRSVYGAIFASLLTIALNGNVYADTENQVLPDEAPTQIIEPEVPTEAVPAAFVDEAVVSEPSAPPPAAEAAVSAAEPTVQNTAVGTEQTAGPTTETDTPDETQAADSPVSDAGITEEQEQKEMPGEMPEVQTQADAASLEHTVQAEFPAEDDAAADTLDSETVKGDSSADDTAAELSGEEAVASDASAESSDDGEAPAEESNADLSALMAVAENETADETFSADSKEEAVTEGEPTRGNSSSDTSLTRTKSGIYVMVNHSGQEKLEAQGDITILAAGVNRVSSISGTGKVRIAGTGILLVDDLQGSLELLTLTDIYKEGSTAVFVQLEGNRYQLVNGAVPGILDEEYRIDNCTLIIPDGGNLLLCGTGAEKLSDGRVVYYHGTDHSYEAVDFQNVMEMTGKLTIAEKAELIIQQGGSVTLENLKTLGHGDIADDGRRHPTLSIEDGGSLTVNGTVGNDGIVWVSGNSALSGSGSIKTNRLSIGDPSAIQNSQVSLSAGRLYLYGSGTISGLTIQNTRVDVGGGILSVTGLVSSGNSMMVLPSSSELDIAKVDGTLALYVNYINTGDADSDPDQHDSEKVIISVSGTDIQGTGSISFESGLYALQAGTELNKVTVSNAVGGTVFDYAGTLPSSLFPLHMQPENLPYPTAQGGQMIIPVAAASVNNYGDYSTLRKTFSDFLQVTATVSETEGEKTVLLDLDKLKQDLIEKADELNGTIIVEFLRKGADGTLYSDSCPMNSLSGSVNADDLCLIRIIAETLWIHTEPDSESTMTGMIYTGSGILGGGAGNVNFGTPGSDPENSGDPEDDNGNGNGGEKQPEKEKEKEKKKPQENKEKTETAVTGLQVWATQEASAYALHAKTGDREISRLDGDVDVFLDYTPVAQSAGKTIYVIFRDADGRFIAFRASYGQLTGKLHFRTNQLGRFVIVSFDFDGEEFSDAFYEALAALPEIAALS
jgi:hypothetical protein